MIFKTTTSPSDAAPCPWIILGIFADEPIPSTLPAADLISRLVESKDVSGKVGETIPLFGAGTNGQSLLVMGLGPRASFGQDPAFRAGVAASKELAENPRSRVALTIPPIDADCLSALVAGLVVGTVGPGLRKAEPERHPFGELLFVADPDGESVGRAVARGEILGDAINLARNLVNTPPSDKTPTVFAETALRVAQAVGVEAEVWDVDRLKAERFGGVLAVARGSREEPRFVHLRYRNGGDATPIALVGKGVTFDSGGLSLKPSASMEDMKCDMTGAAVVLAAVQAASKLKIPINIDAYFALAENMTGGAAMKLGDVLTMRNGLTVEVLNTDAEGRLILADVLSYAVEQKPSGIVDLATLTGACMVALGNKIAGLFSNHDEFANEVSLASRATGERVWRMPMDEDFGKLIKSDVAEVKNVGGKWGGAITAAKFLERFVGTAPWVHLDIAGPSWADDESSTRDAGGTGCFVRTLVALLERRAAGTV